MLIQSLGQKDLPGEGNGNPHSSILALEVPWTEKPGGLQSLGVAKSQTQLSTRAHTHTHTQEISSLDETRYNHIYIMHFHTHCDI